MVVPLKKIILFNSPIGNLKDVSLNFLEKIKEVDIILAENPQKTIKLLNYYNIKKKMITYHERDLQNNNPKIIKVITENNNIGFISAAGSPNIEDPPINLVKYSIENNIEIEIIPGPSALCTALSLSPLPHTPFIFLGFLDKKNKFLQTLNSIPNFIKSIVFFESCHRIKKTISLLKKTLPNNYILILHELTKINQKIMFFKISELDETKIIEKGEYTILIYNR